MCRCSAADCCRSKIHQLWALGLCVRSSASGLRMHHFYHTVSLGDLVYVLLTRTMVCGADGVDAVDVLIW
jgi:hypothetical protein